MFFEMNRMCVFKLFCEPEQDRQKARGIRNQSTWLCSSDGVWLLIFPSDMQRELGTCLSDKDDVSCIEAAMKPTSLLNLGLSTAGDWEVLTLSERGSLFEENISIHSADNNRSYCRYQTSPEQRHSLMNPAKILATLQNLLARGGSCINAYR